MASAIRPASFHEVDGTVGCSAQHNGIKSSHVDLGYLAHGSWGAVVGGSIAVAKVRTSARPPLSINRQHIHSLSPTTFDATKWVLRGGPFTPDKISWLIELESLEPLGREQKDVLESFQSLNVPYYFAPGPQFGEIDANEWEGEGCE
jgi:hypothetical protein